jgi:hypothetical protein
MKFPILFKSWDNRNRTMDLAEIISKSKAKNVVIALAMARLFNAVFWNKIKKHSRISIGSGLSILLFLSSSFQLFGQTEELEIMAPYIISGKWTGRLTQGVGGISKSYVYEIELELNGNQIKGTGVIKTGSNFGYFKISGTLEGNKVRLKDVEITNEKIRERAAWCIKNMPLQFLFKNGTYRLEGPWTGYTSKGDCSPGRIYLEKSAIRA